MLHGRCVLTEAQYRFLCFNNLPEGSEIAELYGYGMPPISRRHPATLIDGLGVVPNLRSLRGSHGASDDDVAVTKKP